MDVDRPARILKGLLSIELQWSHVLMDVDSRNNAYAVHYRPHASMEPRPDGRG